MASSDATSRRWRAGRSSRYGWPPPTVHLSRGKHADLGEGSLRLADPTTLGHESDDAQASQQQSICLQLRDRCHLQANHEVVVIAIHSHSVVESEDEVI